MGRPTPRAPVSEALERECRVELRGIYFDFNQVTLKPASGPALKAIADALKTGRRRITIEGHTDSIGNDRYNDDLSARRAAAVKTALVRDYGVDQALLSTAGYGERRPLETNDTWQVERATDALSSSAPKADKTRPARSRSSARGALINRRPPYRY
jgi:outer membrane protein OmpA-like peptidoglycan-associated protein